jgi:Ulp1 family protease
MLQNGSLLNDNVVQGYINLLGSAFGSSHGVRVVNTHFFEILERQGWDRVSMWMRSSEVVESSWDTAPIILVPIFLGHNEFGHWSNLFRLGTNLKCTIYDDSLSKPLAWANAEKVH